MVIDGDRLEVRQPPCFRARFGNHYRALGIGNDGVTVGSELPDALLSFISAGRYLRRPLWHCVREELRSSRGTLPLRFQITCVLRSARSMHV